jgi:hypothetical protein
MALTDSQVAFEVATEAAFASALSGIGVSVYLSENATQSLPTERIEVVATVQQWGPHQRVIDGNWEYDQAQMSVSVSRIGAPAATTSPVSAAKIGPIRRAIKTSAIQTGLGSTFNVGDVVLVGSAREANDDQSEISLTDTWALQIFIA